MVWDLYSIACASPLIVLPPRHVRHGECSHGQGPPPRRPWRVMPSHVHIHSTAQTAHSVTRRPLHTVRRHLCTETSPKQSLLISSNDHPQGRDRRDKTEQDPGPKASGWLLGSFTRRWQCDSCHSTSASCRCDGLAQRWSSQPRPTSSPLLHPIRPQDRR